MAVSVEALALAVSATSEVFFGEQWTPNQCIHFAALAMAASERMGLHPLTVVKSLIGELAKDPILYAATKASLSVDNPAMQALAICTAVENMGA